MITSKILFVIISNYLFKPAILATIDYEPIQITVNENYNTQPSHGSSGLQSLDTAIVHQGANFYFKPQLNIRPSFIPSHIEALISLIKHHPNSCTKGDSKLFIDKDKLIEVLKPFSHIQNEKQIKNNILALEVVPKHAIKEFSEVNKVAEVSTNAPFKITIEDNFELSSVIGEQVKLGQNIIPELKDAKPIIIHTEPEPINSEFEVIPEAPVLPPLIINNPSPAIGENIKLEEQILLDEAAGEFSHIPEISAKPGPEFIHTEPRPITPEFSVIPEAPVLPPLTLDIIPPAIREEVKLAEQIILEEPRDIYPSIQEISANPEPIASNIEPKPITTEFEVIPEAPVLPPLALDNISPVFGGEIKSEEKIILEEPTDVYSPIPEANALPEPIAIHTEPKPITTEFTVIPEAPVLPPLALDIIPLAIREEVKLAEQIISEEPRDIYPSIQEISANPEPIASNIETKPITTEFEVIPEAPVLPPLALDNISPVFGGEYKSEEKIILEEPTDVYSPIPEANALPEPIAIHTEPKPITTEFTVIPEAPILPPLALDIIPPAIREEVKLSEQIILEEPTDLYSSIQEISANPEPITSNIEPKPITTEFEVIPEAPVLPPLALDVIPPAIREEIKLPEQIILEEPTDVYSPIQEISVNPEPIASHTKSKPITTEFKVIPEAPVLPPLALDNISPVFGGEIKSEEKIILEEATDVYSPIPEANALLEPIAIHNEPKPINTGFTVIPEAPVLPPLALDIIPPAIREEVKLAEQIILEEPTDVYSSIQEISANPEPITSNIEPKPITTEFEVIPEAPVLPPLALDVIPPAIREEIKLPEQIILEEPTDVYSPIQEISVNPEPIASHTKSKPITTEFEVIPEAPVLPPLALDNISPVFGGEIKSEEKIILEEATDVYSPIPEANALLEPIAIHNEPKPINTGFTVIPEAPVLPPLALDIIPPAIREEVKLSEQIILEEPTDVYSSIQEISANPEPITSNIEPKPITTEFEVIPEAPVLPPLALDIIPPAIREEIKLPEQIILEEPTDVFSPIQEISVNPEPIASHTKSKPITAEFEVFPEAPVLPPLALENILPDIEEEAKPHIFEDFVMPEAPVLGPLDDIPTVFNEAKSENPLILEESTGVLLYNPEGITFNGKGKSVSSEAIPIPEAPQLSLQPCSNLRPGFEEVKLKETIKFEESIQEISRRPITAFDETDSFVLQKNTSPEITQHMKVDQVPMAVKELKEVLPIENPIISDSFVLKEVSKPNLYNIARAIAVKKTPSAVISPKPATRQGIFSIAPFISPFSQRVLTKKVMIPKSASLEHFLLKKYPFRVPIVPYPKLTLKAKKLPKSGKKNQILYSTSYAQDIVKERIAPNMFFKKLRKYIHFK